MQIRALVLAGLLAGLPRPAGAEVVTRVVEYRDGDAVLEGYLAYDDAVSGKRPGVLVAHAWKGQGEYARRRARQLAELGYVAFALDIYGKGVRATTGREAGALAGKYKGDRALMRRRARAGYDVLRAHELADPARLAGIGYCFGGTTILELARSGAPMAGVVSFHGGLDTPDPADAKNITGKILALHGGDDPYVPPAEVAAFQAEMRNAGVDWQMVMYGGAVHAFTDPGAGSDTSRGAAYNADADRRSWAAMQAFFAEIFQ